MPGKFENEPSYTEYFYDMANEGMADDSFIGEYGWQIDYFKASPVDISDGGIDGDELFDLPHVILWVDDQGFAYSQAFGSWSEARDFMQSTLGVVDFEDV